MISTVYFAKWILLPDGNILTNGAIVVAGDTITSIGPRSVVKRTSKDRIVNLGKRMVLPGLINIHTHLEEGVARGSVNYEESNFTSWILKKDSITRNAGPDEILSTIRLGIRESLANGITSIVDMSRTDISPIVFRDEPVRFWVFHELSSEHDKDKKEFIISLEKRIRRSKLVKRIGVAPFALFSLQPESHKILIDIAKQNQYLWSCHMAESSQELQAFSEQSGDLHFQITRKRHWPYGEAKRGSMYYAITNNLIPNNAILYHCNYVSSEELSILAAKNVSVVQCGQYSSMFGDKPFPMESALNRGVNICLGTETPVGLNSMNLFDELYHMKTLYPHIPARDMINWVTKNPARALRCSNSIGSLEVGKKADIIGVSISENPQEDLLEELFLEEPEVDFVMVNGEEVIVGY